MIGTPMDTLVLATGLAESGRLPACVCGKGKEDSHDGHRFRESPASRLARKATDAAGRTLADDLDGYGQDGRHPGVGPSDVGRCRRQLAYRVNPPADYTPDDTQEPKWGAIAGSLLHASILAERRRRYRWRIYGDRPGSEVHVPGLDRPGHPDEYDPITGVLYDLKTLGTWATNRWAENGPPEDVWDQLHVYGWALVRLGWPVREVQVIAYERESGRSYEWGRPYGPEQAERAVGWLQAVATGISLGLEQPRDRSGPSSDALCRRCPAVRHCWNLDAAEPAGRSGESWTVLGEEPDPKAVEWAGRELVQARAAARTADSKVEEAKALLTGIPEGQYASIRLTIRRSVSKDWKARAEQLTDWWDEPDRPPLEQLPMPTRTTVSTIITPTPGATAKEGT